MCFVIRSIRKFLALNTRHAAAVWVLFFIPFAFYLSLQTRRMPTSKIPLHSPAASSLGTVIILDFLYSKHSLVFPLSFALATEKQQKVFEAKLFHIKYMNLKAYYQQHPLIFLVVGLV